MLRILALAVALTTSSLPAGAPGLLSREQALAIVASSAKANGYELKNYKLSTFPRELSKDGKEWTFNYECTPPPIAPGCFFFVTVNRESGAVKFMPGE